MPLAPTGPPGRTSKYSHSAEPTRRRATRRHDLQHKRILRSQHRGVSPQTAARPNQAAHVPMEKLVTIFLYFLTAVLVVLGVLVLSYPEHPLDERRLEVAILLFAAAFVALILANAARLLPI